MKRIFPILAVLAVAVSSVSAQSQVKKSIVPSITNLAQIETTVACSGAVTPETVADIKKTRFVSITPVHRTRSDHGSRRGSGKRGRHPLLPPPLRIGQT